jgi:hypothetical protein
MSIVGTQVPVGTSPTALQAAPVDDGSGVEIAVRNRSAAAATVYLGAANVTTSTGFALEAGVGVGLHLDVGETLYGIVASGTVTVDVLEATGKG